MYKQLRKVKPVVEELLQQKYLKQILHYNPETGIFTWKKYRNQLAKKGDTAGTTDYTGYTRIKIHAKKYQAHRLAFLYMKGRFPEKCVDHINHKTGDNRWCNLRDVTRIENGRNCRIGKNNKSGMVGVSWDTQSKKWSAGLYICKKRIHLGIFSNKKDAFKARKEANIKYGFHKNHGKK